MSAVDPGAATGAPEVVVEVRDLTKSFAIGRRLGRPAQLLRAVSAVTFDIRRGETLGLVGESGSGKSTTGRMLVGLLQATSGSIRLFGEQIATGDAGRGLARVRRHVQFIFQDPHGALDPRMRIADTIAEPLDVAGHLSRGDRRARIAELLDIVGLPKSAAERFPHEFSGGQRQRIGIARALALEPRFIVCDEPVSALDVSMQAQIVNLLMDLQAAFGISYLFIAHDLAVVRHIAARVAVMYAGSIVEIAARDDLYRAAKHPYTRALLAAVPRPDPAHRMAPSVRGELPSLLDPPSGCAFHARCPNAFDRCRGEAPKPREVEPGWRVACHLY